MTPNAIQRLVAKNGIASEFINARGEAVSINLAVQTKLLESMGVLAPRLASNPLVTASRDNPKLSGKPSSSSPTRAG
jgi:hypothetical protein